MKSKLLAIVVALVVIAVMLVTACAQPKPTPTPTSSPSPAPSPTATVTPMKITFSGVWASTSGQGVRDQWFMDEITKRTGGAITFTPHWGASLAEPAGHLGLLQSQVAPIVDSSAHYNPALFPDADVGHGTPFHPQDPFLTIKAYRTIRAKFPAWEGMYTKQNVKVLSYNLWAYYNFMSKTPLNTLADLKGKKVGIIGKYFPAVVEAAGMVAVGGPAGERYTNMQSGLIDVDCLGIGLHGSFKIYEVAKYYSIVGLGTFANPAIMINIDFFNKLSPEVQKIFVQTGIDAEGPHAQFMKDEWDKYIDVFKKAGITISEFPKEEITKWAANVPDTPAMVAKGMEDAGYPGFDIMQAYLAELAAGGHVWPRQWAVRPAK